MQGAFTRRCVWLSVAASPTEGIGELRLSLLKPATGGSQDCAAPDRKPGVLSSEGRDMTIAAKVAVLLTEIRKQDVEALSPVERQRFANLCRYVAAFAEPPPPAPEPGVLGELKTGRRPE
jgi:hypothetical protein